MNSRKTIQTERATLPEQVDEHEQRAIDRAALHLKNDLCEEVTLYKVAGRIQAKKKNILP